jgi:hypothetical protein
MTRPELLEVPIEDLMEALADSVDHAVIAVRKQEEPGRSVFYIRIQGDSHLVAGMAQDAAVRAMAYLYGEIKKQSRSQGPAGAPPQDEPAGPAPQG